MVIGLKQIKTISLVSQVNPSEAEIGYQEKVIQNIDGWYDINHITQYMSIYNSLELAPYTQYMSIYKSTELAPYTQYI